MCNICAYLASRKLIRFVECLARLKKLLGQFKLNDCIERDAKRIRNSRKLVNAISSLTRIHVPVTEYESFTLAAIFR